MHDHESRTGEAGSSQPASLPPGAKRAPAIIAAAVAVLVGLFVSTASAAGEAGTGVKWRPWSDDRFEEATREGKLILLNLEAVWCHWCHVMDQETYSKKEIQDLIGEHFIPVRVDQDSRPDLANRYRDYGWPATIILTAGGEDVAKRAGFMEPQEMSDVLSRAVKDPGALRAEEEKGGGGSGAVANVSGGIPEDLRSELDTRHYSSFDPKLGGLDVSHKFLEAEGMELSLARSRDGSERDREMARKTLEANLLLVDPIWGGVYQYSTGGRWDRPHYEKIMSTQTGNLKMYALASRVLGEQRFADTAKLIHRYLNTFLRDSSGAYYTSQDADVVKGQKASDFFVLDDAARRARGIPAIDKHMYARENGWVISALTWSYAFVGDDAALADARKAAEWVLANRGSPEAGFRHDSKDVAGPYLADNVAMGQAFLDLYTATGERLWLDRARKTLAFIEKTFSPASDTDAGFFTAKVSGGAAAQRLAYKDRAENIAVARLASSIRHYAGDEHLKKTAERALRFLSDREMATQNVTEAGILIADHEFREPPLHLTIVGPKDSQTSKDLFRAALAVPVSHKRLEWFDRKEGPLPNPDVQYPELDKPAAYICTNRRCSMPIFAPDQIEPTVTRLTKKRTPPLQPR